VHLDQEVTLPLLEAVSPDAVVVATGARPILPRSRRQPAPRGSGLEVLSGQVDTVSPVVIIGAGGRLRNGPAAAGSEPFPRKPSIFYLKPGRDLGDPISLITRGIQEITIMEMMAKIGATSEPQPAGRSSRISTAGGSGASCPPRPWRSPGKRGF